MPKTTGKIVEDVMVAQIGGQRNVFDDLAKVGRSRIDVDDGDALFACRLLGIGLIVDHRQNLGARRVRLEREGGKGAENNRKDRRRP